jgi:hypothetical protein
VKDLEGASYDKFVKDMQGLSPEQRLKAINNLRMNHQDDYLKMLGAIREHKISDDNLKTGVAIDRIKVTEWSDSKEGKATIEQLEKQYASDKIQVVPKKQIDEKERAMGATPSDASIKIAKEVMDSPDAAAAVIAHEGMHSMHDATNTKLGMIDEETAGNMVMAKVWTGLRGWEARNDREETIAPAVGFQRTGSPEEASLDLTAGHLDRDHLDDSKAMRKYVKGAYTEFHKN